MIARKPEWKDAPMLATGMKFFVQITLPSGKLTLYPATVLDVRDGAYTAVSTEAVFGLEAGGECVIYYELDREFMKHAARPSAFMSCDPEDELTTRDLIDLPVSDNLCVFGFQTVGDPVSAENRQCNRVSTVTADIRSTLGDEKDCTVLDVSTSGFSVYASQLHEVGAVLEATLKFEDKSFSGKVCVQNVFEHHSGKFRYGMYGINDASGTCELEKGRQHINMEIQRKQLRRMTGTD